MDLKGSLAGLFVLSLASRAMTDCNTLFVYIFSLEPDSTLICYQRLTDTGESRTTKQPNRFNDSQI